jgi:hypothetical protein
MLLLWLYGVEKLISFQDDIGNVGLHVFIKNGLNYNTKTKVNILEVGFGAAKLENILDVCQVVPPSIEYS